MHEFIERCSAFNLEKDFIIVLYPLDYPITTLVEEEVHTASTTYAD